MCESKSFNVSNECMCPRVCESTSKKIIANECSSDRMSVSMSKCECEAEWDYKYKHNNIGECELECDHEREYEFDCESKWQRV